VKSLKTVPGKNVLNYKYRKLPFSATGDTLEKPDGMLLVTAHRVFDRSSWFFLYTKPNDSAGVFMKIFFSNFVS